MRVCDFDIPESCHGRDAALDFSKLPFTEQAYPRKDLRWRVWRGPLFEAAVIYDPAEIEPSCPDNEFAERLIKRYVATSGYFVCSALSVPEGLSFSWSADFRAKNDTELCQYLNAARLMVMLMEERGLTR